MPFRFFCFELFLLQNHKILICHVTFKPTQLGTITKLKSNRNCHNYLHTSNSRIHYISKAHIVYQSPLHSKHALLLPLCRNHNCFSLLYDQEYEAIFHEISARTGQGIEPAMEHLARSFYHYIQIFPHLINY